MKSEEAIKELRLFVDHKAYTDDFQDMCRTAIAALEKQIAIAPELEADGYDDDGNLIYDTGYCPDCRHEFEICYDMPDYCPDCGKHLKWPDWVK